MFPIENKSVIIRRSNGQLVIGYYWKDTWWIPSRWDEETDCPIYDAISWYDLDIKSEENIL